MNTGVLTSDHGRLSRRLGWWAGVVIILSGVMAGIILRGTGQAASEAKQNAVVIHELYQLLNAANLLAAERAPSNILLGMAGDDQSEALNKLNAARRRTDIALSQAAPYIPGAQLFLLQQGLQHARHQVDTTVVQIKPDPARLQGTINAMFAVSDTLHDIAMIKAAKWFDRDTSLSTPVLRAIALTELRDTAGRMGSWLIAPVQTHTPLSAYNLQGLYRADERVHILWRLLTPAGAFPVPSSGMIPSTPAEARERFFKEGRPLINQLMQEGLSGSGRYSLSAVELTEHYQSTLSLLERWQYEYMMHLLAEYNHRAEKESDLFSLIIFTMLLITGLTSGGVFIVQFRILRPLLAARKMIVGLADESGVPVNPPARVRELDLLFHSIDILRVRLEERGELTRRLQYLAETDELTGLFNRRAFDLTGESWISRDQSGVNIFLIIMDLDHFKSINDRYGHPTGDRVLISAADVIHNQIREGDIAARMGGEEFAVIIKGKKIAEASALAERIRKELHNLVVSAPDGEQIKISSSFGIAGTGQGQSWLQLITDADSALYRAKERGRDCIEIHTPEQQD
ncbi:GGDEF domain-containing protein [Pantoea sp. App145]|uniref:GGDEF domain-containing protein n=1 Tax=Pantoea sp. App145 TaxID=3071567 RepID=UPI003A7F953E